MCGNRNCLFWLLLATGGVCVSDAQAQELTALTPAKNFPLRTMRDPGDADGDGLKDAEELALAAKYAPVVIHTGDEPHLPTNVDWLLQRTSLWFHDETCNLHLPVFPRQATDGRLTQEKLHWLVRGSCGLGDRYDSYGWADHGDLSATPVANRSKERTFYLNDVAAEHRRGSEDSADWTTYFHVYPNDVRGVTIQFWRCYAFNTGRFIGGDHGGDWEGIHVVLNAAGAAKVLLLQHTGIVEVEVEWVDDTHPVVYVERGAHASLARSQGHERGIRQVTQSGGSVTWPDGRQTPTGRLVNVGEKMACLEGQYFVYYSGLWGSPGRLPTSSGYWGPAFNETDQGKDGFITAWANGMKTVTEEDCYPSQISVETIHELERWTIDKPNVRRAKTTYSLVRLLPGDRVRIEASGCVQTGGTGRTWKRYVDPNPADMYFGSVSIPGTIDGLEPLRNHVGQEIKIVGDSPAELTLGYADDEYADNGYWGHDPGTDDQCQATGDATVVVEIRRSSKRLETD